jgi:glycosyltransferase involved in cell wall biosynthesis
LVQAAGVIACVSDQARQSLASVLAVPRAIVVTGHIVADPFARMASGQRQPEQRQPEQRQPGPRPHLEILCPARLAHHKGIDVLLRAFAASAAPHPHAQLTIAGGGPDSAMLQALAAKLKLGTAVRFAGALAPAQMSQALDRADIVVLPSRSEALPLALLEALACGKPVVATCVGGIPEMIVCGENGMLVAVDDVAGLAAALQQLIADPALRDRLGMAARKSFMDSRHHERRVIPEMLELYRDAQC